MTSAVPELPMVTFVASLSPPENVAAKPDAVREVISIGLASVGTGSASSVIVKSPPSSIVVASVDNEIDTSLSMTVTVEWAPSNEMSSPVVTSTSSTLNVSWDSFMVSPFSVTVMSVWGCPTPIVPVPAALAV